MLLFMLLFAAAGAVLNHFRQERLPADTTVRAGAFEVRPVAAADTAPAADNKKTLKKECAKININRAGLEELVKLHGIGPVLGQRIIDCRSQLGRFRSMNDLLKVKGLGKKRLEKIEAMIDL
jgi:competence protein ComEA